MWVGAIHVEGVEHLPVIIVEAATFSADAERIFADEQLAELKMHLAADPDLGQVIRGTGGIRKLAWGFGARSKNCGTGVVYYYRGYLTPIFLLALRTRSGKKAIAAEELRKLKELITELEAEYRPSVPTLFKLRS